MCVFCTLPSKKLSKMTINFDIDWYGIENRRSAICDYIELMSIHGIDISFGDLADVIRDAGWIGKLNERMTNGNGDDFDQDTSQEEHDIDLATTLDEASGVVENVLPIIHERLSILGDLYPFAIRNHRGNHILGFNAPSADPGMYLSLLSIAVGHTAGISDSSFLELLPKAPSAIFEESVALTLNAKGICTSNLGARARSTNFSIALRESCSEVGIDADARRSIHRKLARDEGCDTISNLWPNDTRAGGIYLAGQATCSKSEHWESKLSKVPTNSLRRWFDREIAPLAYLSVPHHVQSDTLRYLVSLEGTRDVLDRLRLTLVDRQLSQAELDIINAVKQLEITPLYDLI